jgi:hypothetical protein
MESHEASNTPTGTELVVLREKKERRLCLIGHASLSGYRSEVLLQLAAVYKTSIE